MLKGKRSATILIPLKNRGNYTFRVLEYLQESDCKYNILIADGSKSRDINNKLILKNFPNLKITYKRFRYDKSFNDFLTKMADAIKLVKDEYVYMLPNDDFLDLNFLKKAVSFLNKNNKYSCVGGDVININIKNFFFKDNCIGRISLVGSQYGKKSISVDNDDVYKRMLKYECVLPVELLHKKKVFLKIFELSMKYKVKNYHELTWVWATLPILFGKKKNLPTNSLLRQNNTVTGDGKELTYKNIDYKIINYYISDIKKIFFNKKNTQKFFLISNLLKKKINDQKLFFQLRNKEFDKKHITTKYRNIIRNGLLKRLITFKAQNSMPKIKIFVSKVISLNYF